MGRHGGVHLCRAEHQQSGGAARPRHRMGFAVVGTSFCRLAPRRAALLAPRAERDQEPAAPEWKVASEDTLRTPTLVYTPVTNTPPLSCRQPIPVSRCPGDPLDSPPCSRCHNMSSARLLSPRLAGFAPVWGWWTHSTSRFLNLRNVVLSSGLVMISAIMSLVPIQLTSMILSRKSFRL